MPRHPAKSKPEPPQLKKLKTKLVDRAVSPDIAPTPKNKPVGSVPVKSLAAGRKRNDIALSISPDKPLTPQQNDFVRLWATGESIRSAAARLGMPHAEVAYRWTMQPNVQAAFQREKALYEESIQMTRKKVMDMHLEAYEMGKLMAEPHAMVSAAREIGKLCGYYEPAKTKIEVSVNGSIDMRRMEQMSDAELMKMISSPQLQTALAIAAEEAAQAEDRA